MNSRRKGKDGELDLAENLRAHGFECRRGVQYSGANGDADVVGLPGIHIECKRVERLDLYAAMEQAKRDCQGSGKKPAVFHRKNRHKWLVTMELDDFIEEHKLAMEAQNGIHI